MLWFFLLFSTGCWGAAEIFYKKGNVAEEKYSHLKTAVFVGIFFGIYSFFILLTQDIYLKLLPLNFLLYLPVAVCYILSMVCSYFGVRFIEESISDPIENTSGALVLILCAMFLGEPLGPGTVLAIILIVAGIAGVGFFDRKGDEIRSQKYGRKLARLSIFMPLCYMILDAIGTFFDIYYTDSVGSTVLVGVTEDNLEHTANCCYELTFFLVAMGILVFLKVKHVGLFDFPINAANATEAGEPVPIGRTGIFSKIWRQHNKIIAALFETGGQATYFFALSEGSGIAAIILGAGTVIISFILSRIILKEKLSALQYTFIGVIFAGIITLSLIG